MDISKCSNDFSKNCLLEGNIPDYCKSENCIAGIDEAGRGPAFGPMVYGLCLCPSNKAEDLKSMSFADSKTLNEDKRDNLMKELMATSYLGYVVHVLSADFISKSMQGKTKYNLNSISHDTAMGLIEYVQQKGVTIDTLYVDTVGDPLKYENKLKATFPSINSIIVAKKADSKFPIVSASSICAKTVRDSVIKEWQIINNFQSSGSGYTSDPNTKKFLAENYDTVFGFSTFIRTSWSTCKKIMDEKCVKVTWPDDENTENKGQMKINEFSNDKKNHSLYFKERGLSNVNHF